MTFVLPVVPIMMLAFLPGEVRLHNYVWIAPSTAYNLVIFPQWNLGRYGPSSLMAKSLYGWAHFFAVADIVRRKPMGWVTTGARERRPTARLWLWLGLGLYRMATRSAVNFAFLTAIGVVYVTTSVLMPFVARRQSEGR
jgi:cellulose synthase (UDP-forming)